MPFGTLTFPDSLETLPDDIRHFLLPCFEELLILHFIPLLRKSMKVIHALHSSGENLLAYSRTYS
jgi:hypothetical protein